MAHCGCDPELEVSPSPLFFPSFLLGVAFMYPPPCLEFDRLLSKASPSGAHCLGPSSGVVCTELGHGLDPLIHN